jgi:hypothetical protein
VVAALSFSSPSNSLRGRSPGVQNGHVTRPSTPSTHERTISVPAAAPPSTLSASERESLIAAVRTAPVVPGALLADPAVAALASEARRALARGTGRRPEDVEVDVRALPGEGGRVLVFRDAGGRQVSLGADAAPTPTEARGIGRALADWNVIAGVGVGFRVVPGVFSVGAMTTASHFAHKDGVAAHLRAGASTTVGGGAYVWELADRPRPVGPAVAISAPFVSSERDPLLGDKLELSIPGYVTLLAAVKHGEDAGAADTGFLGVVWHQGIFGPGSGPTVNAKLVIGHSALAAPLAPVVGGAAAVLSPVMARLHALRR